MYFIALRDGWSYEVQEKKRVRERERERHNVTTRLLEKFSIEGT